MVRKYDKSVASPLQDQERASAEHNHYQQGSSASTLSSVALWASWQGCCGAGSWKAQGIVAAGGGGGVAR